MLNFVEASAVSGGMTTDELFEQLGVACGAGDFAGALATADEMCKPERAGTCPDFAGRADAWPKLRGMNPEMLQKLQDRIDAYNAGVGRCC